MALSYVNSSSNKSTTTSVSVSKPTNVADGDILIAFVSSFYAKNKAAGTITAPSGWNVINTRAISTRYQVGLFWKRASSEGSSYSFTSTNATEMQGAISAYRGAVSSGNPYSVFSNTTFSTWGTVVRASSMTPSNNGLYVVWGGWYYLSGTISLSGPTSMTQIQTQNNTKNALTMSHGIFTPGLATGNQDGTAGASCDVKHAYMVEILAAPDTKTQTATARIQRVGSKTQTASSRVQRNETFTQTATARIYVVGVSMKNQTATARIRRSESLSQNALARIQLSGLTLNQTATAKIIANTPPNQPTLNGPDDGQIVPYNEAPTLSFTISDYDLNTMECNVQVDTVDTFDSQSGSPLYSFFSASDTGFSSSHPFASGSTVEYTFQSVLPMGKYFWRVASIDSTGSNSYSDWSEIRNFRAIISVIGTSDLTSGTVSLAVNNSLRDETGTISNDGTWFVDMAIEPSIGDSITVFISDASTSNVSTAVTTYSGSFVQGMLLDKHTFSIGSSENCNITLNDLSKYDYDKDNSHILHNVSGSPTTLLCNYYSDQKIKILSGNTLTIGTSETITAQTVYIEGSLIFSSTGNGNIYGDWINNGLFTAGSSQIYLLGSSKQTLSGSLTGSSAFYDLHVHNTSGVGASDNERTDFVPSIKFSSAVKILNLFEIDQSGTNVEFESGTTYEFKDIFWNGDVNGKICFRNSTTSGSWYLKITGLQKAISNIDVSRSDASVSGGKSVWAFNGTNTDSGNNVNWLFINERVRQEINIIAGIFYSSSSSVTTTGISSLYPNFDGTLTSMFDVVATNNDSSTKTIYLKKVSDNSTIAQVDIPNNTTTPTWFRSSVFSYPTSQTNVYVEIPQTTSNFQIALNVSKVVILQDFGTNEITATETQIEIGNYETVKNNTTSSPLNYPKYWKYSSTDWSPTPTCSAEVTYSTSSTANNSKVTIILQRDNVGDMTTWSNVVTIVAGLTSLTPVLSSRVSFTPSNGCNYRLASYIKNASYDYSIYNAKIIAVQSSTNILKIVPQYLVQNTYKNSTGLQNYKSFWNYLEWGGSNYKFYHEINASSDNSDSAKLQYESNGTTADVTSSNATGSYLATSSLMTMPICSTINVNILNSPIYASRILVKLNSSLNGTGIKFWSGSDWSYKPIKYWSGSNWLSAPVKVWDGSQWVEKG